MTNAPYVLPKAASGARMGDVELIDSMIHDGLWSTFPATHGEGIRRGQQGARSSPARNRTRGRRGPISERRAAWSSGRIAEEIVAVEVPQRKGAIRHRRSRRRDPSGHDPGEAGQAEAGVPRGRDDHGGQRLPDLRRCLRGRRDGGETAQELGRRAARRDRGHGMSADRYPSLHTVPAIALERALKKSGLAASRPRPRRDQRGVRRRARYSSARMLGVDEDLVNVNGGAVALGHPIGRRAATDRPHPHHGDASAGGRPRGRRTSVAVGDRATR